jgi:PAS domain S-box-containing protein/putative nucleotidyltransferase with HDIG domain
MTDASFWARALGDSPQYVFALDLGGSVLGVSPALAARLGRRSEELVGRRCAELMHDAGEQVEDCPFRELLLDGAQHQADIHSDLLGGDFFVTVTPFPDAQGRLAGAVHTAFDVTERQRIETRLRESERALRQVVAFSPVATVVTTGPEGEVLHLNRQFTELFGYGSDALHTVRDWWSLAYPDEEYRGRIRAEWIEKCESATREHATIVPVRARVTCKDGTVRCVEVHLGNVNDLSVITLIDLTEHEKAEAALVRTTEQLKRGLSAAVTALGATTELRDPYTAGHQRRVTELAGAIAAKLDWSQGRIEGLCTAAKLHDIGKIIVPAEILSKPAKITQAELQLLREHAAAGARIVADIEFSNAVAATIAQHHERLDGSGYPAGLSGDQLLPEARVLAIADVVEAMISHRPYRPALPLEAAIAEIEGGAGKRYDAAACAACMELLQKGDFVFSEQGDSR